MTTIGIKDLQINPAKLTRALEGHEYTMITKRSKPIGIAIAFDEEIVKRGLQSALLVDAYKKGDLSLGQVSRSMDLSKEETMKTLSLMGVDVVDYDFTDDMKTIATLQ